MATYIDGVKAGVVIRFIRRLRDLRQILVPPDRALSRRRSVLTSEPKSNPRPPEETPGEPGSYHLICGRETCNGEVSRRAPALVAAAILGSGCSINLSAEHYIGKEEKTFAVTGKPELSLKTFDGSIEVTTWDKSVVGVTIERRAGSQAEAEALKVTTSQDGNRIVVEAVQPERSVQVGIHVGRSVRFVVSVPKNTDLVARTGDGSIAVTGVHGKLELRTGDGSVTGTGP